ncbi:MAG: DUF433 domain-containing protein [Saprospiraceae bacterium]|nr:DUF433 domain-containing protein [Saprospiraceae bacterium]
MENYIDFIEINPEIRFGKPCVKNTRISVYDVLGWLSMGMTIPQIIKDFPELNALSIRACLAYAAQKERKAKIALFNNARFT